MIFVKQFGFELINPLHFFSRAAGPGLEPGFPRSERGVTTIAPPRSSTEKRLIIFSKPNQGFKTFDFFFLS